MLKLNKYIYIDICDKDLKLYFEIINTIKTDFFNFIQEFEKVTDCLEVRKISHKLVGVVSLLEGTNSEVTYILKNMLSIDKSSTDLNLYKYYINLLKKLNTNNLF